MTINTPAQAAEIAANTHTNVVGTCQKVTRGYFNAPGAGDQDGDGDFDAYDGWLSEPAAARVPGDRKPPLGYPVSFRSNNGTGHGHRAISFGGGLVRSTDFDGTTRRYHAGVVGTGTIAEVERAMGVTYLGWSKTIDGQPIPAPAPSKPDAKPAAARPSVPIEHTRLVNGVNDDHTLSIDEISAVQKTGVKPYAQAANALHDAVVEAWGNYVQATQK